MQGNTEQGTSRRDEPVPGMVWPCAGLILLVLAVYWPVLAHGFLAWDDLNAVAHDKFLNPPTLASLGQIWTDFTLWFYVPVTYTVWWLLALVAHAPASPGAPASMAAMPFHAANLVAHAANAVLVYALLRRLPPRARGGARAARAAALAGAAVFAVHPLQVESVAFVSTLYTSLSSTFALLALALYLRFSDLRIPRSSADAANDAGASGGVRADPGDGDGDRADVGDALAPARTSSVKLGGGGAYGLATLCFALSLLTKPSLVTLPVIIAILEVGVRGRRRAGQLRPLAPWLLLAAAAAVVTREAQHAWDVYAPLWLRPFVAADALSFYLWKLFVPTALAPVYGRTPAWLEQSGWVLRLTWVVPALLAVAAVCLRRRAPWLPTALLVLLATLAPTLGFVTFNYQRYSTVADHYFYAAMIVVAWLVAAALQRALQHARAKPAAIVAVVVVVLALSVLSGVQVRKWKDMQSLFGNPNGPDVTKLMYAPDAGTLTE